MTAASVNINFGDRPECGAALKAHPDRGTRMKGESCTSCEYCYLEGI